VPTETFDDQPQDRDAMMTERGVIISHTTIMRWMHLILRRPRCRCAVSMGWRAAVDLFARKDLRKCATTLGCDPTLSVHVVLTALPRIRLPQAIHGQQNGAHGHNSHIRHHYPLGRPTIHRLEISRHSDRTTRLRGNTGTSRGTAPDRNRSSAMRPRAKGACAPDLYRLCGALCRAVPR